VADTIPDVLVQEENYVDINALSGIVAGTALVLTNKSTSRIRLQISTTQPANSSVDGEILWPGPDPTSIKLISALENDVWAKSLDGVDAPMSVQDNT